MLKWVGCAVGSKGRVMSDFSHTCKVSRLSTKVEIPTEGGEQNHHRLLACDAGALWR